MNNNTKNTPTDSPSYAHKSGYQYNSPMYKEEESIDLKRYFSLFLSNWYWFAMGLFISLGIAYGINRWSEKVYEVSGSLLIEDGEFSSGLSAAEKFIPGGEMFGVRQNLQNEIGILKSFSLNYETMKLLPDFWITITGVGKRGIAESRQYKKAPFSVVYDSLTHQAKGIRIDIKIISTEEYQLTIGDTSVTTRKFGDRYRDGYFDFTLKKQRKFSFEDDKSNKYYFMFNSLESLTNIYRTKLSISPIEDEASLVTLSISGYSAEQEADYINKLMEVYIDWGLDLKYATADSTIAFINNQIVLISDSLSFAEAKLENFRLNNSLIDLSSEAVLLQTRIEKYENDKFVIEFEKQYYEYLLNYITSRNESGEIVSPSLIGIADPALGLLVGDLADYQQHKSNLLFGLKKDLPAIKLIDSQIADARKILKENVQNSLRNSTRMLEDANARIIVVEGQIQKLPGTERQMISIQRRFDLNNTVYTYLMEKRAEAGIARASTVADNKIIDYARAYNASRIQPQEQRTNMIALVMGLFLPFAFIIVIDLLNNKIIDRRDIEKVTDIPLLGFIGHSSDKSEIPVMDSPASTLAESFRSIRTRLKFLTNDDTSQVISITSTISGEGKTFISVNLAAIIALLGKKVLLVGLDLRKPKLHNILKVDNIEGLSSYLIGELDHNKIVIDTGIKNLFFVPSGPVPPNPAELIESKRMKDFFIKAREEFDYIIVDTPPVAIVTDTLLLSSYIDINLFVVRQRYTSKNTLDLINDLKDQGDLKNLSILINDINLSGYYGYGLRYGNSLGYRGYSYGYNLYGDYGYRSYGYGNKSKDYYTRS